MSFPAGRKKRSSAGKFPRDGGVIEYLSPHMLPRGVNSDEKGHHGVT
jgi:hypothetical protein